MKTAEQKARIRAALQAEGLAPRGKGDSESQAWQQFKAELREQAEKQTVPQLVIHPANKPTSLLWRLAPLAAIFIAGIAVFFWRLNPEQNAIAYSNNNPPQKLVQQTMRGGDVFKRGKTGIYFASGTAEIATSDTGKIAIETTTLTAGFKLRERVDMQIKHPLVLVTITGTEFTLHASPTGGKINLTEGRLKIRYATEARETQLVAPAQFIFSAKSYQVVSGTPGKKINSAYFHYQLVTGVMLYARQLKTDAAIHKIEFIDGTIRTLRVDEIASIKPADD